MWMLVIVVVAVLAAVPASAQVPLGPADQRPITVITPPKPMGIIEFIDEAGIERWRIKYSGEDAFLRFSGTGCTWLGEVYRGMVTPLYDNLTFRTANGKECKVLALEREAAPGGGPR